MEYEVLEHLSKTALQSLDATEREIASERLRSLTEYDSFSYLKTAIVEIDDNSLNSLVILAKALKFVVCNELGPSERQQMKDLALQLVARRLSRGLLDSSVFVVRGLLSVYAAGLLLNFRLFLMNSNGQSQDNLGEVALGEICSALGSSERAVLIAMQEVVTHFQKESRVTTTSLTRAFAAEILPVFFRVAVSHLKKNPREAFSLCILCLESVPMNGGGAPLIEVHLTSTDNIYLHPAATWVPSLGALADVCVEAISSGATPFTQEAMQLTVMMSCAIFTDWREGQSLLTITDGFLRSLMPVAEFHVNRFTRLVCEQGSRILSEDIVSLENGVDILTNIFERHDLFVGGYVQHNMSVLQSLSRIVSLFQVTLRQAEPDDDIRSELTAAQGKILHLFYVIGERGIPPQNPTESSPVRRQLVGFIEGAANDYLDALIDDAHKAEVSFEISQESFFIGMEARIQPLAEMLYSDAINIMPAVRQKLTDTIALHSACHSLRTGGATDNATLQSIQSLSSLLCLSDVSSSTLPVVNHALLSRLALLFGIVATAVRHHSHRRHDESLNDLTLVQQINDFARAFIAPDQSVTDMLLQCTRLTTASSGEVRPQQMLHLPLLRSLVYFSRCIHSTWLARQGQFIELMGELISFALVRHGECFALANDAVRLLASVLEERTALSGTGIAKHLLSEHCRGNIMLTRGDFVATDVAARRLRSDSITALMQLSETRVDSSAADIVEYLHQLLKDDPLLAFEDIEAAAKGITFAVSLLSIVEVVCESRETIVNALAVSQSESPAAGNRLLIGAVRAISSLFSQCTSVLNVDNVRPTLWTFASLGCNVIDFALMNARATGADRLFPDELVCESAFALACLANGHWCNVGIMDLYGDDSPARGVRHVLRRWDEIPLTQIMGHGDRSLSLFSLTNAVLTRAPLLGIRLREDDVWHDVLPLLTRCLSLQFHDCIVTAIKNLLLSVGSPSQENSVFPDVELAFLCTTAIETLVTTGLLEEEVAGLLTVIHTCHAHSPQACEAEFELFLDAASAYHRVRIRSLLALLRGHHALIDVISQFIDTFGTKATVSTVFGW